MLPLEHTRFLPLLYDPPLHVDVVALPTSLWVTLHLVVSFKCSPNSKLLAGQHLSELLKKVVR